MEDRCPGKRGQMNTDFVWSSKKPVHLSSVLGAACVSWVTLLLLCAPSLAAHYAVKDGK